MPTTTKTPPAPTWDLDSIFPGGSKSEEFKAYREKIKKSIDNTRRALDDLPGTLDDSSSQAWVDFILRFQALIEDIKLAMTFPSMLSMADVDDADAMAQDAEGETFYAEWDKIKTELEAMALQQSDEQWNKLLSSDELEPIKFALDEMRQLGKRKMSVEMESLALELAVDGYHSWNRLYDKMAGDQRVVFTSGDSEEILSLGQLQVRMSDPDRSVRKQAFEKMVAAWEKSADLAAMSLNSLAGFRLALYKRRGWDSIMYEPLTQARLSQASLDAMWSVVGREMPRLAPYINAKKKLLGIDKFSWYDQFAPCGRADRTFAYDEAADFIVRNTGEFSSELAEFCRMAVDKRWVEAEDRPGKRAGACCNGTGPLRQTRVFMTYAGTYENMLTLAHELGHSYHHEVLKEKPFLATIYPMTLAETASIFNEMLVTDAALSAANDPQEKLMLLDQNLQQAHTFFCDLHSRYLFERTFYAERASGIVGKDRLCELMIDAQKKAFGPLLDESGRHPFFWASKLHFYITNRPFYNYPYTFGFLFAGGVYDRARKEGKAFAPKYRALLEDSGSMTSEDAAAKHLGVDLTKEEFWRDAVNRSLADTDEFVKLASNV